MKILELNLKKDVLIVDLPIDAKNVHMSGNSIIYNTDKSCIAKPINDDYEFFCKGSELTEEIASELVEKMRFSFSKAFLDYRPYIYSPNHFKTAVESFISAVESKGFYWLENPIGEEPRSYSEVIEGVSPDELMENLKEWQEAEEKTFHNPLIFVKK